MIRTHNIGTNGDSRARTGGTGRNNGGSSGTVVVATVITLSLLVTKV